MKERPILFSGEMVRAILDGRKSMTRRVMKVQPPSDGYSLATCISTTWPKSEEGKSHWVKVDNSRGFPNIVENQGIYFSCPYGQVGDRLWVKETWVQAVTNKGPIDNVVYKADCLDKHGDYWHSVASDINDVKWRSPIFMPRWASRITLEITELRVEKLQEISDEDALMEGVDKNMRSRFGYVAKDSEEEFNFTQAKSTFKLLWDSINAKKYPWDSNPYVWVIGFERVD